ncbi:MAG: alpha-E domain-containing protein, partial [Terriglobales bacterium]
FSRLPYSPEQAVESEEYLEWVGLLKNCAAFEAYCKSYTAELRPLRVAEFLLLNPECPHSVRFCVDKVHASLLAIADLTERRQDLPVRLAGRLRATLSFSQIDEVMASGATAYVDSVRQQCSQAHSAIHQIYFDYPVETALSH